MNHAARGFSMIELLVSIGIIALLLGLLLPSLGGARSASRQTVALVNGRSIAQSFELYAEANADAYPFIERTGGFFGTGENVFFEWYPKNTFVGTSDPFALCWAWPALISTVTPWEEAFKTWASVGADTDLPKREDLSLGGGQDTGDDALSGRIGWRMTRAFLCDPRGLRPGALASDAAIRGAKRRDVRFPAQKAMLFDAQLAFLREPPEIVSGHYNAPAPIAFADGHAELRNPVDATEPAVNILPERGPSSVKLHDTMSGLEGVDY